MSERFDYPTAAVPTTSLVLDTTGRLVDGEDEIQFIDDLGMTKGGIDRAQDYGDERDVYAVSFVVPRAAVGAESDLADVKTFFKTVKRINTFQWTDSGSTVRTVRNISNPIRCVPMTNTSGKYYIISVQLMEQ